LASQKEIDLFDKELEFWGLNKDNTPQEVEIITIVDHKEAVDLSR